VPGTGGGGGGGGQALLFNASRGSANALPGSTLDVVIGSGGLGCVANVTTQVTASTGGNTYINIGGNIFYNALGGTGGVADFNTPTNSNGGQIVGFANGGTGGQVSGGDARVGGGGGGAGGNGGNANLSAPFGGNGNAGLLSSLNGASRYYGGGGGGGGGAGTGGSGGGSPLPDNTWFGAGAGNGQPGYNSSGGGGGGATWFDKPGGNSRGASGTVIIKVS
jgi:hypothetical protein